MLAESVYSLGRAWSRLPRLVVAWDRADPPARLESALQFWPHPWEIWTWPELRELCLAAEEVDLAAYGDRDGYARKIAAFLRAVRRGPTVYADTDVLWLRDSPSVAEWRRLPPVVLAMLRDMKMSYDIQLVEESAPELAAGGPWFGSGNMYGNGDFLAATGTEALLGYAAREGAGLTEQTVLAEACRRLGGLSWPTDEIALLDTDRFALVPTYRGKPWAARHYVGQVRHHFWRDALALRVWREDR